MLLVEDDEPVRKIARMLLERKEYRVFDAASGPAALELFRDCPERVDIVVTDMVLPGGLTGLDVAEKLRERQPSLEVILTSGYSIALAGKELVPSDHVHFLPKPYSTAQLLNAVQESVARISREPHSA